ncbi:MULTISPECIES: ABC transporter ATP-binding protein [Rhizobium]|uniref:ABC transporter ATP-binding protein n=1 Tax=Rhizobium tropici TaxID=398 RepID=A0A6P1C681_RHITR|nr:MULTISPECIES: ABC transporter ATP-binding protein [Rhizobium]AGB74408.1 putative hydrophobic amino acid ABC transporter, ATP-binding protein [Rhizobium tropici CIAT 899]MBB4240890.1 branched-chain amino acid transport system ATP-binding protein [Rhizobium tropici]MBB5591694.1 branched-chain amino acid transport system ATP-binding protein [Rhizobium tropici]MBB6490747.1 branched-chain amino acid transport system ATP-binding protein [Rhizobium tropici]NEV12227.1 ABC transporter ATP-binding pr
MKLLEVENLEAFHGDLRALHGLSLSLDAGECVAVVGANGAGKTTLLRSIAGLVGRVEGRVTYDGKEITRRKVEDIARSGVALVPEGRALFPSLDVEENLKIGAFSGRPGHWNLESIFELFPLLEERRSQRPNTLSGGQQGLVAIGRALMSNPRVLLCDEISLGLAPVAVEAIYRSFEAISRYGTSIVLVEQDVHRARSFASRLYCLLEGRMTLHGNSADLTDEQLARAYFGLGEMMH